MLKTPFVATPPSILVFDPDGGVTKACRAAAESIGMPLRVCERRDEATELIPRTRPLAVVCALSAPAADISMLAQLTMDIDSSILSVHGDEPPEALAKRMRQACAEAENRRSSA